MRVAELMRALANMIDSMEQESQAKQAAPIVVNVNNGETSTEQPAAEQPATDNVGTFIPPLQQKIELLKKSAGVTSVFNHSADEDEPFEG
jgi:ribosomal protein L7/L12